MDVVLKYILFYYHTDRLGSGSAVTDGRGRAVHLLGYMPYGETLLDLSQGYDYETPYQFTGYEKDQETGLHYAEARYYDSWLSTFNSPTRCGTSIQVCRHTPTMRIIRRCSWILMVCKLYVEYLHLEYRSLYFWGASQ